MMTILADQGASCPAYHLCLQDYLQTQFSPAHLLSELGFTIVFDLLLIFLLWGKIIKPWLKRKTDLLHAEIDAEHHVEHHDHVHGEVKVEPGWYYDGDMVRRERDRS